MTTFLVLYRGAVLCQVSEVVPSEGETLGSKIIAKAMVLEQENLKLTVLKKWQPDRKQSRKQKSNRCVSG